MKYIILLVVLLFSGCSGFDVYTPEEVIELEDNTFYSVVSDGVISGDLFYYDGSMKSKEINATFEYACRTSTPCVIYYGLGDSATIRVIHNGTEYIEEGVGTLVITVP